MAHVLAFEAEFLYEEPLGFTAHRVDDFRSQRFDHGVVHRGESLDLSHARAADRIRATLVMRMERHRIPDKEPREARPEDPREDTRAVFGHTIAPGRGALSIDRESRIEELRLARDRHAREPAAPGPGCLDHQQRLRPPGICRQVIPKILPADCRRLSHITISVYTVPVHVEEVVGRGGIEDRKSTRLNSSHVAISYDVL